MLIYYIRVCFTNSDGRLYTYNLFCVGMAVGVSAVASIFMDETKLTWLETKLKSLRLNSAGYKE